MGIKGVHHIGFAVKDLDRALEMWRDVFGFPVVEVREVASEGIRVAFLDVGNTRIELMQPLRGDCAVARFLERCGEGVQHMALAASDPEAEAGRIEEQGAWVERLETDAGPRAFVHPVATNGVAVEIVPEDE